MVCSALFYWSVDETVRMQYTIGVDGDRKAVDLRVFI